jgi:acyl-CoA synthetase (AMP-forming)/AMP-acid ligase II
MLYDRWRQVAQENASQPAVFDWAHRQRWTFGALAELIEKSVPEPIETVFPQGMSIEFIRAVLRAWRFGQIVCPLEMGQAPPSLSKIPGPIVHVKTTSASTGAPRLIAFTAAQLVADAANIVTTMGLKRDWPNLGVISLAHSYGFSNLVLPLLLHGIPLVLLDSALPEAVRRAAASLPDITLPAVPALWRVWHEAGAIPKNVRLAISAGAPLPLQLEEDVFQRAGLKLHNFYGSSECGGIAYDTSHTPRFDAAGVGAPLMNVLLSVNERGNLVVRSEAVAEGYWPEPSPNLGQGCYHTSDLAELSEGRVFLRGRAGDQINVAGRKISPEGIEKMLLLHPEVSDCLVFGVPSANPSRSELIVACVATRASVPDEVLKQFLLSRLPAWQVPREWWFVPSLETNQRGKLSRAEWRKKFLERTAEP